MSVSVKPRLADRQPSFRGGVPRVKTWPVAQCGRQARAPRRVPRDRRGGTSMTLALDRVATETAETVTQHDIPTVAGASLRVPLVTGEQIGYANLDHAASAPCLDAVQSAVNEFL